MTRVVVIGGGIVGTATALHLAEADAGLDVVLVEADPTYTKAATGKGTGGIRQLFTRPENILLSQYTLDVVEGWETWAGAAGEPPGDLDGRPTATSSSLARTTSTSCAATSKPSRPTASAPTGLNQPTWARGTRAPGRRPRRSRAVAARRPG